MAPIEPWKETVGFEKGMSALYKSWRAAAKLQMTYLGIASKSGAPAEKWTRLTEWTLQKRPFRSQAHHHNSDDYRKAVDGLLMDVAKKRAHTLRGHVDLDERGSPETPPPGMYLLSNSLSSGEANPNRTDPCLSVGSSCRYVRITYHNPDRTRPEAPAGSFWEGLAWRVPGCLLFWGILEAPTMSSLAEMICREVEVVMRRGKLPRYLVGATARGQRVLVEEGTEDALDVGDMIFLRTDHHVRTWWSVGGKEYLDLLLLVRRKDEDQVRGREVTPKVGHIPYLPRTLFGGLDSDSPEEEEEEVEEKDENALGEEEEGGVSGRNEERAEDVRGSGDRTSTGPLFLEDLSGLFERSTEREVSITTRRSPNPFPTPVLPRPPHPQPTQPAEVRPLAPADVLGQVTETGVESSDEDQELQILLDQARARRARRARREAEKAEREKAEREKAEKAQRDERETAAPRPPRAESPPLSQPSSARKTAEERPSVPAGVTVVELSDEDLSIDELVRNRRAKRARKAEKATTALSQPEELPPPATPTPSAPRERPSAPASVSKKAVEPAKALPGSAKKRKKTGGSSTTLPSPSALLPPPTTPLRRLSRSAGGASALRGESSRDGARGAYGGVEAQRKGPMEEASGSGGKKASRGRGRASELVDSDYEDMP